jgi:TPR repeat protein
METKKTVFSKINASVNAVRAVEDYVLDKRITGLFRKKDYKSGIATIEQELRKIASIENNLSHAVEGEELKLFLRYIENIRRLFDVVYSICIGLDKNLQGSWSEYKWDDYRASLSLLEQKREICGACQNEIVAFSTKARGNLNADLKNRAGLGDPSAQFDLAGKYAKGDGVLKSSTESMKWIRKAAENGHAEAQYMVGETYSTGDGVPKDYAQAVQWFRKAAEQGNLSAQIILCSRDTECGRYIPQHESFMWCRKAAEQGHAKAQFLFGLMYTTDDTQAVKWFRKASGGGHLEARLRLSQLYYEGRGVQKDILTAYMWCKIGAMQNDAAQNAISLLEKIKSEMNTEQITEGNSLANNWILKHG